VGDGAADLVVSAMGNPVRSEGIGEPAGAELLSGPFMSERTANLHDAGTRSVTT